MTKCSKKNLFQVLTLSTILIVGFSFQSCVTNLKKVNMEKEQVKTEITSLIYRVENEAWTKGNTEILDEMYDPNCIIHMGSSMEFKGTKPLKQMIAMFKNIIPDRSFKIEELIFANDKVTERYNWKGTFKNTGKKLNISGCIVYHFKNNKVVEVWNFEDMLGLYQQLGYASESPFGK